MSRNWRLVGQVVLLVVVTGIVGFAGKSQALMIDEFSTDQSTSVSTPDMTASNQVLGGGILGGERDITVVRNFGTSVTAAASFGEFTYSTQSAAGMAGIIWDGEDGSADLDPTGLGGIDFTDAGVSAAFQILFSLNDFPVTIKLTVYTDAANFSVLTSAMPVTVFPDPPTSLVAFFSDFVIGAGAGADFSNVGAFKITLDGSSAPSLDTEIEFVRTVVPEPGPAILLSMGLAGLVFASRGNRSLSE